VARQPRAERAERVGWKRWLARSQI